MALSFSVFNKFKAIDGVTTPVNKMRKSVNKFGKTTTNSFKRADAASSKFVKRLKSLVAITAIVAGVGLMTAGIKDAIRVGAEFEQTIVDAGAKFGGLAEKGSKGFNALADAAKKAGKTTEFSATQAAGGLNFLAMAGFDVNQSIAALPGVIDLATAANIELSRASDIATDTLGAFNLVTKDAAQLQTNLARVTDVMAKTSTTANTDMEQLFETFTTAAPIATSLGASIETVSAMAGVLGNAGIKASTAGTTLKNVFTKLAAATPAASKQLEKFGVKLKDSSGNFRDVFDILGDLNTGLSDLGDVERAAVLNDIFGKIPIAGVNVLLQKGTEGLKNYRTQLENSTGAAKTMAEAMRNTLGNKFKIFQSTLEGLKITIFETLSDNLEMATGDFTDLIRVVDEWLQLNQGAVKNVLTNIFAAFSAVGGVIMAVVNAIRWLNNANSDLLPTLGIVIGLFLSIKTAMIALNVVMAITNAIMAANPFGIAIIAIAALILAVRAIIKNWDVLKEVFINAGKWIAKTFEKFKPFLKFTPFGPMIAAAEFLIGNIDKVGNAFSNIWKWISEKFLEFTPFAPMIAAAELLVKNIDKVKNAFSKAKSFFGLGGDDEDDALISDAKNKNEVQMSQNAGVVNRITEQTKNKSTVDVNFNNLPQNAEVKKDSDDPGFSLGLGFAGAS